jgi:hypothetical protein
MLARDPREKRMFWSILRFILVWFAAVTSILVLALIALAWHSCSEPPGAGKKAARCYRSANVIMKQVYQYRHREGRFPATLDEVRPRTPQEIGATSAACPIEYREEGGTFSLSFRYSGPGMNACYYASESRKWKCAGWF